MVPGSMRKYDARRAEQGSLKQSNESRDGGQADQRVKSRESGEREGKQQSRE
jgi:hypothetical protein